MLALHALTKKEAKEETEHVFLEVHPNNRVYEISFLKSPQIQIAFLNGI